MKIEMKDSDNTKFEVGYDHIPNTETGEEDTLFWIDTPYECVTLHMDRAHLDRLAAAIQFLKAYL